MHVLSVLHGNTFGGPHNRNALLAPVLRDRYGVELTVLIPDEPGDGADRLRRARTEVVQMPIPRLRSKFDPRPHVEFVLGLRGCVADMKKVLRSRDIDLVLINGISNPHAAFAARDLGIPIVWQILDSFPPKLFLKVMMPYVRRTAGAIMSTGRRIADAHLGARGFDRLVLFHPPVDTGRFRMDLSVRRKSRETLGLSNDALVVGNVSNFNRQKGHRTFIRAAALLKRDLPDVKFVILGQRYVAHADYFRQLMNEVEQLGLRLGSDLIVRDPEEQVAELAMAFDFFWMTSEPRSEGIPTAVEEAMALGLPVVATDVGSISEIVLDDHTGFLIAPRDSAALAKETRRLIDDSALTRRISLKARQFAENNFAREMCAQRHAAAFELAAETSLQTI